MRATLVTNTVLLQRPPPQDVRGTWSPSPTTASLRAWGRSISPSHPRLTRPALFYSPSPVLHSFSLVHSLPSFLPSFLSFFPSSSSLFLSVELCPSSVPLRLRGPKLDRVIPQGVKKCRWPHAPSYQASGGHQLSRWPFAHVILVWLDVA